MLRHLPAHADAVLLAALNVRNRILPWQKQEAQGALGLTDTRCIVLDVRRGPRVENVLAAASPLCVEYQKPCGFTEAELAEELSKSQRVRSEPKLVRVFEATLQSESLLLRRASKLQLLNPSCAWSSARP